MKKILIIVNIVFLAFLVACDSERKLLTKIQQENLYQLAVGLGYSESIDDWINSYYHSYEENYVYEETQLVALGTKLYYKNKGDYTTPLRELVSFDDLMDPDGKMKNLKKDYMIDDEIIKWKLSSEKDNWHDLIPLKKLAIPIGEPEGELEYVVFGQSLKWNFKGVPEWNYIVDIKIFEDYLFTLDDLRSLYRTKVREYGLLDLDVSISVPDFRLIPMYDYAGFKPKESGYYTIFSSSPTTKFKLTNENVEILKEGIGSVDIYLEKDKYYSIGFQSKTFYTFDGEYTISVKLKK